MFPLTPASRPWRRAYLLGALLSWWVAEDAFITFRYARNWAAGLGPVFNPGLDAPVEGYSNFLWLGVATLVEAVGLPSPWVVPWISLALGVIFVDQTWRLLREDLGLGEQASHAGTAMLALSPVLWVWASSGLETLPHALCVLVAFRALATRGDATAARDAGLALAGLVLVRTEGLAWAGVLLAAAALARARRGEGLGGLVLPGLVALGVAGAHEAFRVLTYGAWVPNTAVAKVDPSAGSLLRGARYVVSATLALHTPGLALFAVGPALRHPSRLGLPVLGLALLAPATAVLASGDWMPFFRLLVPGLPFLAALGGLGIEGLASRWTAKARRGLVTLLLVLGAMPYVGLQLVPRPVLRALQVTSGMARATELEALNFQALRFGVAFIAERAVLVARHTRPGDTWATAAIGASGYYAPDVQLLDAHGLVSREVAALDFDHLVAPGHDKRVPIWFFYPQRPTILGAKVARPPRHLREIREAVGLMRSRDTAEEYYPQLLHERVLPVGAVPWTVLFRRGADADARAEGEAAWAKAWRSLAGPGVEVP